MERWLRCHRSEFVLEAVVVIELAVNGEGKRAWIDVGIFIKAL